MKIPSIVEPASAALEELAAASFDQLGPVESTAALRTLKQAASKLNATIARLTHHVDVTGAVVGTGSRDAADWLARQTGTSARRNRSAADLGAAMARSDELADAVTTGTISSEKATVIAAAASDEAIDQELIAEVTDLPLNGVRPAVESWRARQHPDRDADVAKVQRARRYLRITDQPDGMRRIDGLLDPQSADIVRNTLDSIINASAFDDTGRTREQRHADALTQLCSAASKGEIEGGRSNARLLVTASYETVVERGTDRGRTHTGATLDPIAIRQLACDAGLHRVIAGPGSSILDFGHQTRLVSENQFNALVVRDQHCRWPGCTLRATWCDAHHIVEWAEGGPTNLDNLALFCHHHHLSHQPGWTMTGTGDRIEIHHPDGTTDTSRPPDVPRRPQSAEPPPTAPPPRPAPPRTDPIGREPSPDAVPAQLTLHNSPSRDGGGSSTSSPIDRRRSEWCSTTQFEVDRSGHARTTPFNPSNLPQGVTSP